MHQEFTQGAEEDEVITSPTSSPDRSRGRRYGACDEQSAGPADVRRE